MTGVSFIIPVKDDIRVLRVVDSVAAQLAADGEILLADDGTPGAVPKPADARVRVIPTHSKNSSIARNEAARSARGDVLLFTDADARIPPGWVAGAVPLFEDPSVVAVQGNSHAVGTDQLARRIQFEYERFVRSHASIGFGDLCDTRCFAIRRQTLLEFLFDEVEPWCADADLGRRLYESGLSIDFRPEWSVGHFYRESLPRELVHVRRRGAAAARHLTRTGRDLFRPPHGEPPRGLGGGLLRMVARWPALAPSLAKTAWAAALGTAVLASAPGPLGRRLFDRAFRAALLSGRISGSAPSWPGNPAIPGQTAS